MNLDGKCPNPHYLDSNCTCPRPEQPHTSKEEEIVEEFKKRFCYQSTGIVTGFKYGFRTGDFKAEKVIDFILQIRQQALTEQREETKQFILNVLDGIDMADEQMQNKGGGTKAIRLAFKSRGLI